MVKRQVQVGALVSAQRQVVGTDRLQPPLAGFGSAALDLDEAAHLLP
jgi:hypothetical protein